MVVTANHRLARWLRQRHAATQTAAAWRAPEIVSWDNWLITLWSALPDASARPQVLSPHQELLLWEQTVAADDASGDLLDLAATARAAAHSWALVHAWQLDLSAPEFCDGDDSARFQGWARALASRCAAGGWITIAELAAHLTVALENGRLAPPPHIEFAGFDELTPAQSTLLALLRRAGCASERLPAAPTNVGARAPLTDAAADVHVFSCHDAQAELEAAAAWAADLLAAGEPGPIGVVAPEMGKLRATAERIFQDRLHPDRAPWDHRPRAFHLSLGAPLADQPIVAAAFAIWDASHRGRQPLEAMSRLLRSPYLGGAQEEAAARARLDARLRREHRSSLALSELRGQATPTAPVLQGIIEGWLAAIAGLPPRPPLGHWAESLRALLAAAGWPAVAPDTVEYQAVEALHAALDALSSLEQVWPAPVTLAAAIRRMRQATARVFQPPSATAPIQIMGWLEAAGMTFPHLWVLGLDAGAVPAPPRLDPFLPPGLQRRHGLPHATAARENEFARRRLLTLTRSAPRVLLSYAKREGDARLGPSPLLAAWPAEAAMPPAPAAERAEEMEELADAMAPALAADRATANARVFEDFAACPFRAFAHARLGATALEAVSPGLSAQERGNLNHEFLSRLWEKLGGSHGLAGQNVEALAAIIAAAAVAATAENAGLRTRPALSGLEQARLIRLGERWLELERQRPPFTVELREQCEELDFAGLHLRLRLDRLDRLEDGRAVLLDYKSSAHSPGGWEGPRPEQAQLPLYAVTRGDDIAAIAFANLAPGDTGFRGWLATAGLLPGHRNSVPICNLGTARAEWRATLARIATDYLAGAAAVDPKRPQTCEHCNLHAVCRIGTRDFDGEEAGDE